MTEHHNGHDKPHGGALRTEDVSQALEKPEYRLDGPYKVSGRARYVNDVRLPGTLFAKFLLSPYEMKTFIDEFNSPYIGAYVDVANMLAYGHPEDWLRVLGKRVAGIHFKDFKRAVGTADGFCDLLEGDVNWPGVMAAIREIGYDGPVVGEMIPLYRHFPEVRIANTSRAMDAILSLE